LVRVSEKIRVKNGESQVKYDLRVFNWRGRRRIKDVVHATGLTRLTAYLSRA
jgi:hypothetical protein